MGRSTKPRLYYHPALTRRNALRIADAIAAAGAGKAGVHCLMLDMEDTSLNDATITLHDDMRRRGLPVALTLQAYLRRTADDLSLQVDSGSRVRLVKGAFAADAGVAFTRHADIKSSYQRLLETMFSPRARASGFYPIAATHDDRLHALALGFARQNGWAQGEYEFEMLLGVRPDVSLALAKNGERIRLYLPFGRDWWPYAARRIGETPSNALLLARSVFG